MGLPVNRETADRAKVEIRLCVLVGFMLGAMMPALASAMLAAPDPPEIRLLVRPAGDEVTISWQLMCRRSGARVALYRLAPEETETLVFEAWPTPGVHSYSHVDTQWRGGGQLYQLRLTRPSGKRTVLGTAICFESGTQSTPLAAPPGAHSDLALTVGSLFGACAGHTRLAVADETPREIFQPTPPRPPP